MNQDQNYKQGLMEGHNEDDNEHQIDYDFYDEYIEEEVWQ